MYGIGVGTPDDREKGTKIPTHECRLVVSCLGVGYVNMVCLPYIYG